MIPNPAPPEKSLILIFVNRTESVQEVVDSIKAENIECSGIHAGLDQLARDRLLQHFSSGNLRILVSTNLLGRGIDVPDIKWVINYDMPGEMTDYVHRIGRTGRGGRKGVALTLLEELDLRHSRTILDVLKASGDENVPSWLDKESRIFRKYWKMFYEKKRQDRGEGPLRDDQKPADPKEAPGAFSMEWRGRGGPSASRIDEVLRLTGGLGIAMPDMSTGLK